MSAHKSQRRPHGPEDLVMSGGMNFSVQKKSLVFERPIFLGRCDVLGTAVDQANEFNRQLAATNNSTSTRVHSDPPHWNAAPSQDLLVIRDNHATGETTLDPLRSGPIPALVQGV